MNTEEADLDGHDMDELRGGPQPWPQVLAEAALAGTPYIGGSVAVIARRLDQERLWKAQQTYADVIRKVDATEFAEALERSSELSTLFGRAIWISMSTALASKRRLLARVIAQAAVDDAKIDESHICVDVLEDLDAVHIRSLARLVAVQDRLPQNDESQNHSVAKAAWIDLPVPVRAALSRTGCSMLPVASTSGVMTNPYGPLLVSQFGRDLLDWINDADEEEPRSVQMPQ
jgi:hypothetical protein